MCSVTSNATRWYERVIGVWSQVDPGSKVQEQFLPKKITLLWVVAHLPSVASIKVWKARTAFRLIKFVLYPAPCLPAFYPLMKRQQPRNVWNLQHLFAQQWIFINFPYRKNFAQHSFLLVLTDVYPRTRSKEPSQHALRSRSAGQETRQDQTNLN